MPDMDLQANDNGKAAAIVEMFAAEVGDRHRPLALIVRFRVKPAAAPAIVGAFAHAARKTAGEDGALAYQLHQEPADPCAFIVYERWRCLDDLEAHLRTPHITALRRQIDEAMEGQPDFRVLLPA